MSLLYLIENYSGVVFGVLITEDNFATSSLFFQSILQLTCISQQLHTVFN